MISRIITLILSLLILLVVFIWSEELILLTLFGTILILLVVGFTCLSITSRKTTISAQVKNSIINGEPIKVILNTENKSILPVFRLIAKINVINMNFGLETTDKKKFSMCGREEKQVEIEVQCDYCGKYFITIEYIRMFDFWGIFSKKIHKKQTFETCMYPQYYNVNSISQIMRTNYEKEKYFSHRKGHILSEILQYREYQKGDNLKLVNWKLSSKYDDLIVREFDTPTDNQLLIIFDTFEGDNVYKNIVYTVLVSISITYAQNNISHYVSWYNPVKKIIENHSVERYEDVFFNIKNIFETETEDDHISIGYLLENRQIDKYAKVIYITNKLTDGIKKELVFRENIKTILVDEFSFNKDKIKQAVSALNV